MMARRSSNRSRIWSIDRVCLALMLASLAFVAIIEAVHGHSCTDHGCMLCLAAAIANALFATCAGLTFALPVLRAVAAIRPVRTLVRLVCDEAEKPCAKPCPCVRLTPISMGVRLLI